MRTPTAGPAADVVRDACSGAPGDSRVPLVAFLGRLEAAFVEEFDRRIRASEFCALSLAHSHNVLRHLGGGPLRASQIVRACDVSKQAISQQVAHLEANGYVEVSTDPLDTRARMVALTPKGERAQVLVRDLFVEIERDWAAALGPDTFDTLRSLLGTLAEQRAGASACR